MQTMVVTARQFNKNSGFFSLVVFAKWQGLSFHIASLDCLNPASMLKISKNTQVKAIHFVGGVVVILLPQPNFDGVP